MRLLLDTQAFIESNSGTLPPRAAAAVKDGANELFMSIISLAEIDLLTRKKRFAISSGEAFVAHLRRAGIAVLPFTTGAMLHLFRLPMHHRDPFDRMIISTALDEDMHVIAGDQQFQKYKGLKLIWH